MSHVPRSLSSDHLQAIDELVSLEKKNAQGDMSEAERDRRRTLTHRLFSEPQDDRRRYFRIAAHQSAEYGVIGAPQAELQPADVTSISAGGVFLQTATAVDPTTVGSPLKVRLRVPSGDEDAFELSSIIRWVTPPGATPVGVGVEFDETNDKQRTLLLNFLRSHLLWQLDLSRQKYRFFFQRSTDLAILLDPEAKILEINDFAAQLLGETSDHLIGKPLATLVGPDERARVMHCFRRARGHEETRALFTLRGDDGPIAIELKIEPFHVQDLRVGAIVTGRDLRHERQLEQKHRALERRLFQADKLATIGQITAGIAHDINNPLAYVLSNLEGLDRHLKPLLDIVSFARRNAEDCPVAPETLTTIGAELTELIRDSLEGSRRIAIILRDVRHFAILDQSSEGSIAVNELLDASVRAVSNVIKHRARLERDYGDSLPNTFGNVGRVSQIFINLLTNAAQSFPQPDTQRNLIRLRTRLRDGQLEVEIHDNGRGIPEEVKHLIFEPFFSTRRGDGGTGLGLAIAKESAEAVGGTLAVDSTRDKGTTFTITLPVTSPQAQRVNAAQPSAPAQIGAKILIIDDEPALVRGLQRMLSLYHSVTVTTSAKEGLEIASQHDFDAILCDVMMPEMSGFEVRRRLEAIDETLVDRMIFMTGGTFTADEQDALRSLPNVVLRKPLQGAELLGLLGRMPRQG